MNNFKVEPEFSGVKKITLDSPEEDLKLLSDYALHLLATGACNSIVVEVKIESIGVIEDGS